MEGGELYIVKTKGNFGFWYPQESCNQFPTPVDIEGQLYSVRVRPLLHMYYTCINNLVKFGETRMRCNEKTKIGTFKYEKLCLVRNAYVNWNYL